MRVTVELAPATLRRLEAEPAHGHRFAFAGVAASGDGTLSERYKAIRRAELDT